MYQFALPGARLKYLVNRFFQVTIPGPSTFDENRVIPHGTGAITFILEGEHQIEIGNRVHSTYSRMVSGRLFPTFSIACDAPFTFCGIALKPTGLYRLFGIHLAKLNNQYCRLEEMTEQPDQQILDRLIEAKNFETRTDILTQFLINLPGDINTYDHLDVIIDLIYQKEGLTSVKALCETQNISRSYLEKRFKKMIGTTPGRFIKHIRFNFACTKIAEGKQSLGKIFADHGYYDRSHFMKTFKSFHGEDLSRLAGESTNIFKEIWLNILRSDSEKKHHP